MKEIEIRTSKTHGKGIFAKESIKKGERIQYIHGKPIHKVVKNSKESKSISNWIGMSSTDWYNTDGTPFRYINHSCNPNSAITGSKTLVAIRAIKENEEITIDYSMTDADPFWGIQCHCGESNCRKVIQAIYTVPLPVFKRHLPFVSKRFQKIYFKHYLQQHKTGNKKSDTI